MTLREVAQQLGKSESTIYKNFKTVRERLKKKGIILTKWGKDDYEIEYEEIDEDEETYLERLARERKENKGDK